MIQRRFHDVFPEDVGNGLSEFGGLYIGDIELEQFLDVSDGRIEVFFQAFEFVRAQFEMRQFGDVFDVDIGGGGRIVHNVAKYAIALGLIQGKREKRAVFSGGEIAAYSWNPSAGTGGPGGKAAASAMAAMILPIVSGGVTSGGMV